MKKNNKILPVLAGVLLFLFIVSTGVVTALNARFLYYHDIKALKLSEQSGLSEEVIRQNYDVLIDYNQIWNTSELNFPDFVMSEGGRIHFREVKLIFVLFQLLLILSALTLLALRLKFRQLAEGKYARLCGYICFSIAGLLGILALIGFDKLFVVFHKVFFRNDYWIFDAASDPVISILPEAFFLHEALLILGIVMLGGLAAWILGRRAKKRYKES